MKRGRSGTLTHDYIRHGTTTLFAALNLLDGMAISQCTQRHRNQEFLRHKRDIPAGQIMTWPDVAMADTEAVRARREMERRFSPLSVATTTLAAK